MIGPDDIGPEEEPLQRTEPPRPVVPVKRAGSPALLIGAVAAALLLGGLARWYYVDRSARQPEPAAAAATEAPSTAAAAPAVVLPPLNDMDPFLRVLLGTLSSRPELSSWLATDNLIQQMAIVIDRVAHGTSPAGELKVLAPSGPFATTTQGSRRSIDPATFRRRDGVTETVASVDSATAARVYQTIRPRLNEAYLALGRTDDVDAAVVAALSTLAATPVVTGPIQIVEGQGATWKFADPALEGLDPAQKQLIRLGPENAARVQAKLAEIAAAIRQP